MKRVRRGRQPHHHPIDNGRRIIKHFHDHNQEPVEQQPDLKNTHSMPSTSQFEPAESSRPPQNGGSSKWVSRNRSGSGGFRPRFVEMGKQNYNREAKGKEGQEKRMDSDEDISGLGSLRDEKACEEEGNRGGVEPGLKGDSNGEITEGSDSVKGLDDIGSRLKGLQLGAKEPELSEELLRSNDQLQEDELVAMESIYGDNMFILCKQGDLRSFQIHIQVEAPSELTISTKLTTYGDLETKTDSSSNFSYSFKVHYLPPIVLTCLLPKSYPSHLPPYFTISVQWMDSWKISELCSVLDSVWKEQPGQEVIYHWVEWLQGSCLSYLGFDKEIVLGPYGSTYSGDRRAISGSISPDVDIPSMKNYNDEQNYKNFLRNLHECCICFSEFAGSEFIRLPCEHFFCWKCMKTYSDMHVKEGTISKLLCPTAKCGGMVPPGLLKRLLGDEKFERWESLMLQKTLESMTDVTYCPRCETVCIEDEDHHAQCSNCFFSFCTLCRGQRHVGVKCLTPEMRLRILQGRQNSSQLKDDQKRRECEMINEFLSVREILRDAKQCPSCKMAISRTEGCNKMECQNCGEYFCYLCNKAISGYEHFREEACELFPQEMIQNWEQQINDHQEIGLARPELVADRDHSCPICGQINVKAGNNNHIFCWACQNHYCYLCRKIVRRSSKHFGPKGCKQHTAE